MSFRSFAILFFFACVFGGSLTLYHMDNNELRTLCVELTQIDEEEADKLNETRPLVTDNRNAKCYIRCLLTGLNMMNIEGEFTPEFAEDNLLEKIYFRHCQKVQGEDLCDKAFNYENCVWEQKKSEEQ